MRIAGMLVLAAAAVPAIVGSPAGAVFVGVNFDMEYVQLSPSASFSRYRFYARFSSDQDRLVAVQCGSVEGSEPFYQHVLGSWTEPLAFLLQFDPSLAHDTFVTIGLTSLPPEQPATVIAPGSAFPGGTGEFHASWSAPADAPHTHGPSVLIAQLTFQLESFPTTATELHFVLEWIDGSGQEHAGCMSLFITWDVSFPCYWPHRADINHDCAVNGLDVALLLSEWDVHVDCAPFGGSGLDCPDGDMSCDGGVDGYDLAILLADWGPVSDCQLVR